MPSSQGMTGYLSRGLSRRTWFIICIILLVLHLMPWIIPNGMHLMIMIYIYAVMGQGWNVLGGYAGAFSFGHAIFFGVGAYVSTLLFMNFGLTPWLGILCSGAAGTIVALIIGFLVFRYGLSGPFFALSMLAFAEISYMLVTSWKDVGGALGLLIPSKGNSLFFMQFVSKEPFYFISLWMMIGSLCFVWYLERTRLGLYLRAVREDNDAAESLGVNAFKVKMIAMGISGGMTAMGGTVYAQYLLFIDPASTFATINSVEIMIRPIIGGPGTVLGPLLGSVVLTPLSEFTRLIFQSYSGVYLMFYGMILVIVIMFLPNGLMGIMKTLFHKFRKEVEHG